MAAGAATERIKLGTGICLVIERDPIVTAKAAASVDRLTGGRLLFGVGAGWNLEEMRNHGTDPARRFCDHARAGRGDQGDLDLRRGHLPRRARRLRAHLVLAEAARRAAPADHRRRPRQARARPGARLRRRVDAEPDRRRRARSAPGSPACARPARTPAAARSRPRSPTRPPTPRCSSSTSPRACTGRCSGSPRATSPTSSAASTGSRPGSRPTSAPAERRGSELRGVELEPEQRAARRAPRSPARRACAGSPRGRRESGAGAGSSRRSPCRRRASRRRRRPRPRPRPRGSRPAAARRAARPGSPRRRAAASQACRAARVEQRAGGAHAGLGARDARLRRGPLGELARAQGRRLGAGELGQVVERAARDPERDRGDRRGQQAEGRERVQRPALARRVGDQRRRARRRDRERRRRRCRGCRSPAARRPTRCRSPRPSAAGISTRRMSGPAAREQPRRARRRRRCSRPSASRSCRRCCRSASARRPSSSSPRPRARPIGAKTPPTTPDGSPKTSRAGVRLEVGGEHARGRADGDAPAGRGVAPGELLDRARAARPAAPRRRRARPGRRAGRGRRRRSRPRAPRAVAARASASAASSAARGASSRAASSGEVIARIIARTRDHRSSPHRICGISPLIRPWPVRGLFQARGRQEAVAGLDEGVTAWGVLCAPRESAPVTSSSVLGPVARASNQVPAGPRLTIRVGPSVDSRAPALVDVAADGEARPLAPRSPRGSRCCRGDRRRSSGRRGRAAASGRRARRPRGSRRAARRRPRRRGRSSSPRA